MKHQFQVEPIGRTERGVAVGTTLPSGGVELTSAELGRHTRWHKSRGIINSTCQLCSEGETKA